MRYRAIGDLSISVIGLGAQNLSVAGRPDRETAIATIHAALDAGVTIFDTSDAYTTEADGQGHNELLVAEGIRSYEGPADTSVVTVSTKGGLIYRDGGPWIRDGSPKHLRDAALASRDRLQVPSIALYHLHRPDPERPFEASIETLRDLLDEGVIARVGLSNVDLAQIEVADRILGGRLVSVENPFSPGQRVLREEMAFAAERGIAYLLWGPLGGLGGAADIARRHPAFADVAEEIGVGVHRVALAWELRQGSTVVSIPGAVRPEEIVDSAAAAEVDLSAEQMDRLDRSEADHV